MPTLPILAWKSLLIKRRSWVRTLFELIFPALVFLAIIVGSREFRRDFHLAPVSQVINSEMSLTKAAELNALDTNNMSEVRFGFAGSPDTLKELRILLGDTGTPSSDQHKNATEHLTGSDSHFVVPFESEKALVEAVSSKYGVFWLGVVERSPPPHARYTLLTGSFTEFGDMTRTPWSFLWRNFLYPYYEYASSPFFVLEALRVISLHHSNTIRFTPDGSFPSMNEVTNSLKVSVATLPLPDLFVETTLMRITMLVASILLVGFAMIYIMSLTHVVSEKESRIAELLQTMGTTQMEMVTAWWLVQLGVALASASLIALAALVTASNHLSTFTVFALYIVTASSFVTLAITISPLFTSVRAAQLIGAVLFLVLLTVAYFAQMNASTTVVNALCLIPGVGFFMGVRIALDFLSIGEPFTLDQLSSPVMSTCLLTVIIYTFIGFLCISIVGLYLNLVIPSGKGASLPWHFFVTAPLSAARRRCRRGWGKPAGAEMGVYWAINGDGTHDAAAVSSPSRSNMVEALFAAGPRIRPGACVEPRPTDADGNASPPTVPVVQLRSLRREFRAGIPAVRCLDLDIHRGELVALLGRSGAGKSTVLAMITGALAPTSGWIRVCGQDVTADGGASAGLVGVCPQDNTLYDGLTVADHLDLFARMKGLNSLDTRKRAVYKWADRVGLGPEGDNKLDAFVKDLSGGQKRKLCLAMAFVGDPKLVIIDEPTAGLDLSAQRSVRELLHKERHSRAILLSTHLMEEAEVCDRVAILANGSLQCAGSPAFLKHQFGTGYTLVVAKVVDKTPVSKAVETLEGDEEDEDEDEDAKETPTAMDSHSSREDLFEDEATVLTTNSGRNIFFFLRSFLPGLRPTRDVVGDVCFSLPSSSSGSLPAALLALDAAPATLGVGSYTVSIMSLDDVFRRVSEDARVVDDAQDNADAGTSLASELANVDTAHSDPHPPSTARTGGKDPLLIPHDQLRHDEDSDRQDCMFSAGNGMSDVLLPVFTGHGQGVGNESQWGSDYEFRRLYPGVPFFKMLRVLYWKHARAATREALSIRWQVLAPVLIIFMSLVLSWAVTQAEPKNIPLSMELFPSPRAIDMPVVPSEHASVSAYRKAMSFSYGAAEYGTFVDTHVLPDWLSDVCKSPLALDYFYNAHTSKKPRTFFRPFSMIPCEVREFPPSLGSNDTTVLSSVLLFNSSANRPWTVAHISEANAWMHAVHTANHKPGPPPSIRVDHRAVNQFLGLVPTKVTSLKAMVYGIALAALVFLTGVGFVRERASGAMHLWLISGAPRGTYWLSHMLWEITLALTHVVALLACLTLFDVWEISGSRAFLIIPGYILHIIASIPIAYFASYIVGKPENVQIAVLIVNAAIVLAVSVLVALPTTMHDNFNTVISTLSAFVPLLAFILFMPWVFFAEHYCDLRIYEMEDYLPLYILFVNIIFMWSIVVLLEADIFRGFRDRIKRIFAGTMSVYPSEAEISAPVDPDVAHEEDLIFSGSCDNAFSFPVVLKGLRKVYPSRKAPFVAVSHLSFAVSRGQCFGFLGANGAGKSTTMRMLTGDEQPTAGAAYINGFDTERDRVVASMLTGYCPQADAFCPSLTPRENLHIFAVLRGISKRNLAPHVNELLSRTGLAGSESDVASEFLSVGNKRKLSVAIALIGNPPVVILDEPTAGIDPRARHEIWNLVSSTMANRSVILTTHSMEECEALCDRIGIMSGGVMRCIGVPSNVKSTHGSGFSCSLSRANDADAKKIEDYINAVLPGSQCISCNGTSMTFHVPLRSGKTLADVFSALDIGREHGIGTYSACSADLGDVFVNVVCKGEVSDSHQM